MDSEPPRDVLIVDDDPSLRRVVARSLHVRGFSVVEADTVAAAIAAVQHARPALVLLDIELPDGTGWDFLRLLREQGISLPVAIVSASQARAERVSEFKPVAVLRKPFPLESLLRLAAEWAGPGGVAEPAIDA